MKAVVIGAGLAGLATAHGLQAAGVEVSVVERSAPARSQGSGLSLFANGLTALRTVGLGAHIAALTGGHGPTSGGQRTPDGAWQYQLPGEATRSVRVVHRAELHAVLMGALQPHTVRFETSARVLDPGTGQVQLDDGAHTLVDVHADVVVCADGIRSQARAAIGLDPGLRYAGYGAWRGVTPGPILGVEPCETWGRGLRFGLIPLPDNRIYWFAVRSGALTQRDKHLDQVRQLFGGWHDPIPQVLDATPAGTVSWSPIDELARPLPTFVVGRCVLVGDAAHAMTPNLGQGGNQGLEDAATLTRLLGRFRASSTPEPAQVRAALARYDDLRRPRTQRIALLSRWMGEVAQAQGPVISRVRDALIRVTPSRMAARSIEALSNWTPPA